MDEIEDWFPRNSESVLAAKTRADNFKKYIFDYIDSNSERFPLQKSPKDPKIAVVTHSMFTKILTTQDQYWDEEFKSSPEDAQVMPCNRVSSLLMNCEFKALNRNLYRLVRHIK